MRIGVALTPNADEHQKLIESGRAIDRAAEAAVDGFVFWFDTSDLGAAVEQVERLGGLRAELG